MMNTSVMICFLKLAIDWPGLMKFWGMAEANLPSFRNEKHKKNFMLKLRSLAFIILFMAIGIKHFY